MIVIPASLRSDFIHMAGMTIHIALESTIHIVGIRNIMLAMSKLVATSEATSTAVESRIGFATEGGGQWAEWDRFITLDGKKAYHIGNICGTCAFVFERLPGANDKLSPAELSAKLRTGLTEIEEGVVRTGCLSARFGREVSSDHRD